MNVFDLMAKLTLDKSEYTQGLDGAEKEAGGFASKLKTGLGTAAKIGVASMAALGTGTAVLAKKFVSSAGSVAEYGDNIDKMSQKIGISAKAYQEWDFIAQHSGTSMESLKVSFKTLSNAAQSGADEFKKLGISLEDASKMSTEDLFGAVIKGLQNMEAGTERTAIASKLLGRGATELGALLNTSAEETENMKNQVHELGGVMSDEAVKSSAAYQDSLQNLQVSMSGIRNKIFSQFLPSMVKVSDGLAKVFSGDKEGGLGAVKDGIDELIDGISEKIPDILEVGGQIVGSLAQAIMENIPKIIEGSTGIISTFVESLVSGFPQVVETGGAIIYQLASGLGNAFPTLVPTAVDAISTLVTTLIDNAPMMIEGALSLMTGLGEGLINAIPTVVEKIPQIIESLVSSLINSAPKLLQAGVNLVVALGKGLIQAIPRLIQAIPQIAGAILNGLASLPGQLLEVGKNLIKGLWNGIASVGDWIKSKISGFFGGIVGNIKNFFGIKSPSRLMRDQIGKYMAQGVGVGFVDEMDDVKKDITNSMDISAPDIGLGSISYGVTGIPSTAPIASAITQGTEVKGLLQTMIDKLDNLGSPAQIILDTGVLVGETVTEMNRQLGVMANMNERSVLA